MTTEQWWYVAAGVGALYLLTRKPASPIGGGPSVDAAGYAGAPNPSQAVPAGANSPGIAFDTPIGTFDVAAPMPPLGFSVGVFDVTQGSGAMSPLSQERLAAPGGVGTTIVAPNDAAGRCALAALRLRPTPIDPNPVASPFMTISKISPNGMGVVPPAPADRTSVLSPEIRRFQPQRTVAR